MGLSSSCVHQTTAVIPAELATEYSHHTEEFKIRRTKTFLPSSKDTFKVTKRFAKNAKKALKQIQKGVRLPDTSRKVPSTTAASTSLGVCEVSSTTGEFLEINSLDPNYYVGWEVHVENYGVGNIRSCTIECDRPNYFMMQLIILFQDGRLLSIPYTPNNRNITYLQKLG